MSDLDFNPDALLEAVRVYVAEEAAAAEARAKAESSAAAETATRLAARADRVVAESEDRISTLRRWSRDHLAARAMALK